MKPELDPQETNIKPLENESRLRAIIETAIDGIITIDQKGIIETINPAAAKIFEYTPEEVIGQNVKILMPDDDRVKHDDYIDQYHKTGKKKIIGIGREVAGKKKSGRIFPFLLSVSEVILEDKVIYTGIIHDISELKEAETAFKKLNSELEERVQQRTSELFEAIKELKETNARQKKAEAEARKALEKEKELSELKSRFVSLASHEFRTPLSTILSSASLVAKYNEVEDKEKIDKHIKRIKSSVTNLTSILNDFLSLSKLEEGVLSNNPTTYNLKDLGKEMREEMLPALKEKQKLKVEHIGTEEVFLDRNVVKNILLNLVSNAIKYSVKGTIEVKTIVNNTNILISVKDEGIGIPDEDKPFLFTRFFRARNAGNIQGTGLGLNIVKRYVELLNGYMNLETELGKGTTITIEVPGINDL